MKIRICAALLIALLISMLTACSPGGTLRTLDAAEDAVENRLDAVEDAVEDALVNAPATTAATGSAAPADTAPTQAASISSGEAEAIALKHAGFTADQVQFLRTEFEIDDRIPHYDISFYEGRWEYEYEIHSQTGEILSYERDD